MQMSRVWNNDVALDNRAFRRSKVVVLLSALENPSLGRPVISWSGEFSSPRRLTFGAIMSERRRQLLKFSRAGTTRRSDLGIRECPQMTEGREAFFQSPRLPLGDRIIYPIFVRVLSRLSRATALFRLEIAL